MNDNPTDTTKKTPEVEVITDSVEVSADQKTIESKLPAKLPKPSTSSRSSKGLVPYDALSAYLREIRQYPKLSREEEHDLALRYRQNKDIDAAYQLVSSNLWLVVKIARDYEQAARNLLDLVQEGNMGLMEAVKKFDPYRGVRFPSYAAYWIKAYIVRFIIANFRLVKLGTTQAQRKLFFNLNKEKEKLEKMGIYPGPKLLAEKLNVKESEVIEMQQRLGSPDMSVDAPVQSTEGDVTMHNVLPSEQPTGEELVAAKQQSEFIKQGFEEFSSTLKDKELIILEKRMVSEDKATLQELSDELGISRERVRQIENRIKEKLKTFFDDRLQNLGGELEL